MSTHDIQLKIEPSIPFRERVYQHLRNGILSGRIPQSTILVEARLAAQIGISRTPMREALHFLEKEGLLEALPRVGYRVRKMEWTEIEEICEVRKVVEALGAKWAVERIQPEQLDAMEENLGTCEAKYRSGDTEGFVDLDAQFHEILARASGSQRLVTLIQSLRADMIRYRIQSLHRAESISIALAGHRRILQCIKDRDKAAVEKAILEHLEDSKRSIHFYSFGAKRADEGGPTSEVNQ